jgi:formylglycine-generating enzyme required for sulfatase activity
MHRSFIKLFAAVFLIVGSAFPAFAEKRVALVIGNDVYKNLPIFQQLKKARNDARSMGETLKALGFQVTIATDVSRFGMNRLLDTFLSKVEPGDTAALFFAGHGVRIKGRNYILPSDIPNMKQGTQRLLARESIAIDGIVDALRERRARISMLILDACRNNPFKDTTGRSIGGTRGLARMEPPEGTFVLFSAGAGQEALDRLSDEDRNPNSVFTRTLIPLLKRPGLEVGRMARLLRQQVKKLASSIKHAQTPAVYNEVTGDFYLTAPKQTPIAGNGGGLGPVKVRPPLSAAAQEWQAIQNTRSKAVLKAFIKSYPRSVFAKYARARLKELDVAIGIFPKADPKQGPAPVRAYKPGNVFKDCKACPEMVVIPKGSFMMGSLPGEGGRGELEVPQHRVTFVRNFAVGKFEVTFAQWHACVSGGGCKGYRPKDEGWGRGKRPVINVSWHDAKAYVAWLSKKTGKTYRLLTEAEWEYAARAGTNTGYWWGSRASHRFANYGKNECCSGLASGKDRWVYTAPVGSFPANAFGLHDTHGNVFEWTEDCWHSSYAGAPRDGKAWTRGGGGDCLKRISRGGSWNYNSWYLRSASRGWVATDDRDVNTGFRVARDLMLAERRAG